MIGGETKREKSSPRPIESFVVIERHLVAVFDTVSVCMTGRTFADFFFLACFLVLFIQLVIQLIKSLF